MKNNGQDTSWICWKTPNSLSEIVGHDQSSDASSDRRSGLMLEPFRLPLSAHPFTILPILDLSLPQPL